MTTIMDTIIELEESKNPMITDCERYFINLMAGLLEDGEALTDTQRARLAEIAEERL